jgi:hypothetical protein
VLNRIYIVVGIFAIVVLAGAFIAPRFIHWGDYRDRMEVLATDVLGADVTIRGDIGFSLLPSPRLEFTDVVVGDTEAPAATVGAVEAEFALMDFLRDIYTVTALNLVEPVVHLTVDENGLFTSGVAVDNAGSGLSIGQTRITDGSVRLEDLRSAETHVVSRIDGDLRLSSFSGPFQFAGGLDHGETRYNLRFSSSLADGNGSARVSSFLSEAGGAFSATLEGTLASGAAPKFDGSLVYRQAPPPSDEADDIRGDLVLESQISASTDRVLVSGFTLHPDENRAGMRLTGTASIQLGARNEFDAAISGGVFSLPPRDATEVAAELPYEFVRLLSEIPAPPLPPLPGTLGIDLAEVTLRGFALRDLRLDASTDGTSWQIEQAVAQLPGDTEVRLSGTARNEAGQVAFLGDFSVNAQRLDGLSAIWRRAGEDNPLFNTPGTLEGSLQLGSDALAVTNGRFGFADQLHAVQLRIGFGAEPRLDLSMQLGNLTAAQTNALLALAPNIAAEPSFAVSFPDGSLSLGAQEIDLFGLPASELVVQGQWSSGNLRFDRLAAADWGGIRFDTALDLAGDLSDPRVTGSGDIGVASPDADGLTAIYEMAGLPFGWQEGLAASMPADLAFNLSDTGSDGGQVLTLNGEVSGGALDIRAEIAAGVAQLADADLRLIASLEGADPAAMQRKLGLGEAPLFGGGGAMLASLFLEGSGPQGFDGRISLSQGEDVLSYFGRIDIADTGEVSGDGSLDAVLADAGGLAALAGVQGVNLASIDANAALTFTGSRTFALEAISGIADERSFSGTISMQRLGQLPTYSGNLDIDSIDALGLASAFLGADATAIAGAAIWPEGPLATEAEIRPSRGDIAVRAASVALLGGQGTGETSFTYSWTPEALSIDRFEAQLGNGVLSFTLDKCCAGPLDQRTLTGRLELDSVGMDALLPPTASGLGGSVTAGMQFEGTGASLAEAMRVMAGEGNFSISEFEVAGLSPNVFPDMARLEDPLDTEPAVLETLISIATGQGAFAADEARGAFTIAGGTVRFANLIVQGAGGLFSGSLDVALTTLGLDGNFVLTPRDYVDPNGLIETDTARVILRLAGSLLAPEVSLDPSELAAAIQVRANELEVERLEELRIEDEARQREAAEARNRLIEEQRRQAAEEAARRAAEEALQQPETQEPAPFEVTPQPTQPLPEQPFELDLQPQVNQPIGTGVNDPIQLPPPN